MFWKMIIAIFATIAVASLTHNTALSIATFIVAMFIVLVAEGVRIVPQQNAWVVERFGKFFRVLEPGLNLIVPFFDRVAYRHSLKEVPMDVPEQVCITKDNTQLSVDGILYYQVIDPRLASYGSSDYVQAITQLAQTTLRSAIGKMELDKTFESRDEINHIVVQVLDEAGRTWGIKVLRYEIKSLTPPESILRSMQAQITAEREKRAVIATSEGKRQQEINVADGARQAAVLESEGQKAAQINKAAGEAGRHPARGRCDRERGEGRGERDRRARRHGSGEPEGRGPVHRSLRQPRQAEQHAHHPGERLRRGGARRERHDGARPDPGRPGGREVNRGQTPVYLEQPVDRQERQEPDRRALERGGLRFGVVALVAARDRARSTRSRLRA